MPHQAQYLLPLQIDTRGLVIRLPPALNHADDHTAPAAPTLFQWSFLKQKGGRTLSSGSQKEKGLPSTGLEPVTLAYTAMQEVHL